MAKEYDNNNTGALFVNDKKEDAKHPDYKGNAEVGGVEYWLSGWKKTGKQSGKTFLSLSFTPKDPQPAKPKGQPAPTSDVEF